ncbi:MAG: hypothetical protein US32_C0019G0005 [candidate division TM6 bacterium GW2011_GWA2_36_9]|nr:MAG: hypothetical protein US32_C0019G0005 [candidate division TM6 bacterium GW2011_GWA2_36_9]
MKKLLIACSFLFILCGMQPGLTEWQIIYAKNMMELPGIVEGMTVRAHPAFLRSDGQIFYCMIVPGSEFPCNEEVSGIFTYKNLVSFYPVDRLVGAFAVFAEMVIEHETSRWVTPIGEFYIGKVNITDDDIKKLFDRRLRR